MRFSFRNAKGMLIEFLGKAEKEVRAPSGVDSGDLSVRAEVEEVVLVARYHILAKVDGRVVGEASCRGDLEKVRPVKLGKLSAEAYKLPEGTELVRVDSAKFVMPDEALQKYNDWLAELEASGETEETLAFRRKVEAKSKGGKRSRLEKMIAEAEGQASIPATKAEAKDLEEGRKAFLKEEHDGEWAEGFSRRVYSLEELEEMRAELARLS